MLHTCEQVVDVVLGSGVPHISNLQALASPSSTIWPQALFDLNFTGNASVHTQHTWETPSLPSPLLGLLGPYRSCLPFMLGLFNHAQVIVCKVANSLVFSHFKRLTQVALNQIQQLRSKHMDIDDRCMSCRSGS